METNVLTRTDRLGERYCNSAKKTFCCVTRERNSHGAIQYQSIAFDRFHCSSIKKTLFKRGKKSHKKRSTIYTN